MTKLYETIVEVRVRVEADSKREARREIGGMVDALARNLETGLSVKYYSPDTIERV